MGGFRNIINTAIANSDSEDSSNSQVVTTKSVSSNKVNLNDDKTDLVTMTIKVDRKLRQYWMGKIKSEGLSFKDVMVDYLIQEFGLPEDY